MRSQATRTSPKQEAYRAYWESRGYTFKPGELAPESTLTPPSETPTCKELLVSAALIAAVGVCMWWLQ